MIKKKLELNTKKIGSYYNDVFFDYGGVLYNGLSGKAFKDVENSEGEGNYKKYGIEYNGSGEIIGVDGVDVSYLKTYAISNRRIFILRNEDDDLLSKIFNKLSDFLADENYSSWANGLVHIYNAKDSLASGAYIDSLLNVDSWFDVIEYTSSGNLKLKNGLTNTAMIFDTEGWTPRYGLSQDFLISLHLATLAPDFVETLVQSYDTEVQVYLDTVEDAKAHVKMIDTASSQIGTQETGLMIADFTDRFNDIDLDVDDESWFDLGWDIDAWYISEEEAARFYYATDMNSPNTCTSSYEMGIANHEYLELDTDDQDVGWTNAAGKEMDSERESSYVLLTEAAFQNDNVTDHYICTDESPELISYNIVERVKKYAAFLARNKIYGFTTENLEEVNELMVDNESCATEKAYNDVEPYNPHNDYGYFAYGDENYIASQNYPSIYLSPNSKGLELEEFFRNNTLDITTDDDSVNVLSTVNWYGEDKYVVDIYGDGSEVYELDGHVWNNSGGNTAGIGSTCFFEYGKYYNFEEWEDTGIKYFDLGSAARHTEGAFCDCDFCEEFWNKYYVLKLASYGQTVDEKYVDEIATNPTTGYKEYLSDFYSWEYTNANGEIIQYNLSFYLTDHDGGMEVILALTRSWTEAEVREIQKAIDEADTCTKKIERAVAEVEVDSDDDEKTIRKKKIEAAADVDICNQCRKYVKYIVDTLKDINDESYSTYVPYIARVIDSWFRDTYFIIPTTAYQKFDDEEGNIYYKEAAIYDAFLDHGYNTSELTGENLAVIENDSEFLDATGELWTKYMMNPDGDDYAVFLLDTTGELLKSKADVEEYLDKIEKSRNIPEDDMSLIEEKYVDFEEYVDEDTSGWGRWKGEDRDLSESEREKAEELLEEYSISLVKIPVTKKISEIDSAETTDGIAWSAYSGSMDTGEVWQDIEKADDAPKNLNRVYDYYAPVDSSTIQFKVGLDGVFNIVQTEDAQRGMTNSKIKFLFKNKKYYIYDGTVEKTYAIYDDWNTCVERVNLAESFAQSPGQAIEAIGRTVIRQYLRPTAFSFWENKKDIETEINNLKETALNSYIDAFYYQADSTIISNLKENLFGATNAFEFARDFNDDGIADIASLDYSVGDTGTGDDGKTLEITESTKLTNDPRNPDLIDNIDLTTESLAAFSILENTKTLDADYAYRDLKELFCELDYFDKEDLTEPPTEVMEWLLPDSGSYGYPIRMYDKSDEYGTLIHSKEMYDNLNDLWLNGLNSSGAVGDFEEAEDFVPSGGDSEHEVVVEETQDTEETTDNIDVSKQNNIDYDKLYALSSVSSRAGTSTYITVEDEVKFTNYYENGYTVVVKANGIQYKSFKQGSGAYYTDYPFWESTMQNEACGVTSTAIVLSAYGDDADPWDLAQEAGSGYAGTFEQLAAIGSNHGVEFESPVRCQYDSDIESCAAQMRAGFAEGKPAIIVVGAGRRR